MDATFPTLSELPEQLRSHLQQMIDLLVQANLRNDLPSFMGYPHIFRVSDADGTLRCLFKAVTADDEQSARNEACVYLLDHPEDGHRSVSPHVYGFSGVPPCIFVRFMMGNEMMMGSLMEFVESEGCIGQYDRIEEIAVNEMHKITVADVRFGNMDRNEDNLLVREGENGSVEVVPIDHEMSFANDMQDYNICKPFWIEWLEDHHYSTVFSPRSVRYVEQLDPDRDLAFLRQCGWQPGASYSEKYRVFATFLKKAVSQGVTAYHIGLMASYKCDDPRFNLQDIIDSIPRGDNFYDNVDIQLEERMREYHDEKM